jgi:eukaryotic translation initiation factor 2C
MSVRMATGRLLMNISPKSAALVEHGPLIAVTSQFADQSQRTQKLAKFLEKVKIEVTHLPVKKNKSNQVIPRVKTICGLATTRDGFAEPQGQRPRVRMAGASPHVS